MSILLLFLICFCSLVHSQCLPAFNTFFDVGYSSFENKYVVVGMCGDGPGGQKVYTSTDGGNSWHSNSAWQYPNVWLLSGVAYGGTQPTWVLVLKYLFDFCMISYFTYFYVSFYLFYIYFILFYSCYLMIHLGFCWWSCLCFKFS
jgi:hypothetical protein